MYLSKLLLINLKENIYQILKKYWGHDNFRSLQYEIIYSVINKNDTLALLPTGGGKSLCFQLPAIILGGTTLVVSPLIALMNDQVQNLKKKGFSAISINAAMNFKEIDTALNNAALGKVQFLYISPERLQSEVFRQKLSYLPITLIAVDEAHCISQWGYDFRPSYLKIGELRDYFLNVKIIALTASATKSVIDDIQLQLNFKNQSVFKKSFTRNNLRYVVQEEDNKTIRLLKLVSNIGGSGIVYLRNRKKTEELALFLNKKNITAKAYHAGMNHEDRQNTQQQWLDNKVQIITATNAFGMGIDKSNVRFVVHLDLPESLEAYFQEAGRAGRDSKISYSTIFFSKADQQRLLDNFNLTFPDLTIIKKTYQSICNFFQLPIGSGQDLSFDFDIDNLCKSYNLLPVLVYNSIKFLEKENYLSFVDLSYEPSKLKITSSKEDLYHFQILYPKFEPLIKTLLRSYGGLFEDYVYINEKDLAYRIKTNTPTVLQHLNYLNVQQILSFIPQSNLPKIIFLQDRVNGNYLEFSPDNYKKLKEKYFNRINSVIDYINNNKICRHIQLLMYFNEFNYRDCGHCDVCINKRPKDFEKIKNKIYDLLKIKHSTLDEIKHQMTIFNDESWLKIFNEMIDDGLIKEEKNNYYLVDN